VLLTVAAAVLVICGGALIATATGSGTDETPPIRTAIAPNITLTPPDPVGSLATRLTWSGAPGLTYTVVVAKRGAEPRHEPVGEATTLTVATEPTAPYCFQVRGTNGQQVVQSNVQSLRGATC
jgi:eukaryotic-like serine/threonine-protein kinase